MVPFIISGLRPSFDQAIAPQTSSDWAACSKTSRGCPFSGSSIALVSERFTHFNHVSKSRKSQGLAANVDVFCTLAVEAFVVGPGSCDDLSDALAYGDVVVGQPTPRSAIGQPAINDPDERPVW